MAKEVVDVTCTATLHAVFYSTSSHAACCFMQQSRPLSIALRSSVSRQLSVTVKPSLTVNHVNAWLQGVIGGGSCLECLASSTQTTAKGSTSTSHLPHPSHTTHCIYCKASMLSPPSWTDSPFCSAETKSRTSRTLSIGGRRSQVCNASAFCNICRCCIRASPSWVATGCSKAEFDMRGRACQHATGCDHVVCLELLENYIKLTSMVCMQFLQCRLQLGAEHRPSDIGLYLE